MVKSLTISNYKAFGLEPNTLEIKPVTVIVGKNNSGKSSILKLLSILSSMSDGETSAPILLRNEAVSLGGRYQDLFHNNETSSMNIQLEFEDGSSMKSLYLMNEGELYNFFHGPKVGEDGNITFIADRVNPFRNLLDDIVRDGKAPDGNPFCFSTNYIGPLRREIPRNIQPGGIDDNQLEADGRNVCEVLLSSFNSDKKLFRNVAAWLADNLDCPGLSFERNSEASGSFSLSLRHGDAVVNLADVGQGIGQVLPLLTASYMPNHADITIVEQPVLHLHPAAHQAVARRVADSAIEMKRAFLVETHSHNFLLSLRDMIVDPAHPLTPNDVAIYFVEQDEDQNESWLRPITIEKNGEFSDWPEGVFAEGYDILRSIRNHVSNSKQAK